MSATCFSAANNSKSLFYFIFLIQPIVPTSLFITRQFWQGAFVSIYLLVSYFSPSFFFLPLSFSVFFFMYIFFSLLENFVFSRISSTCWPHFGVRTLSRRFFRSLSFFLHASFCTSLHTQPARNCVDYNIFCWSYLTCTKICIIRPYEKAFILIWFLWTIGSWSISKWFGD